MCTHHVLAWTDSEVVIIEVAEKPSRQGFTPDFFSLLHVSRCMGVALPPHLRFPEDPSAMMFAGDHLIFI